jgi:hypothetical protein
MLLGSAGREELFGDVQPTATATSARIAKLRTIAGIIQTSGCGPTTVWASLGRAPLQIPSI